MASTHPSTSSGAHEARRVAGDLAQRRDVGAHHRGALRHRLEHRDAEPLVPAREREQVGAGEEREQVLAADRPEQAHPVTERLRGDAHRRRRASIPVARPARVGAAPCRGRAGVNASSSTRTFLRGWKVPAQNTYGRSSIA